MAGEELTPLLTGRVHTQDPQRGRKALQLTLFLVFSINFLLFGGQVIALAPRIKIYESIICRDSSAGDIDIGPVLFDEERCKNADVQAELAFLLGIEEFLTVFLSVLSIPYSFVADRLGWSCVLSLSLCGVILEIVWPLIVCMFCDRSTIQWVWCGVVFEAIGGGITVTVTMLNLILANVVPSGSRTRVFLHLTASTLVASALGQILSTILMRSDVWLAAYIGCSLNVAALGISLALLRTARDRNTWHAERATPQEGAPSSTPVDSSIRARGIRALEMLRNRPSVAIVLLCAFAFPLGEDSMFTIILVYISKRYGWSIADANLLMASSSVAQLFTLIVGVPGLGSMLVKYCKATSYTRDRIIVQVEGIVLVIGALCTAMAPNIIMATGGIVVLSFGMAIVTVLRSLVADLVPANEVTLLYSMMSMMMRIGSGIAGPLFAWSFAFGMALGPGWIGLPFIISALLFLVGTVTLFFLPLSRP